MSRRYGCKWDFITDIDLGRVYVVFLSYLLQYGIALLTKRGFINLIFKNNLAFTVN